MRRHLGRATALGVAARRRKAGNVTLLRTLQDLGVDTSLELCLDAGAYGSYTGSGQSWLDLTSNGYDFFRGADGNASTDDPTWNGTAGALTKNEYWSFDGGDFFTYDTTNETWMENLHKDNAAYTFAAWWYFAATGTAQNLFATKGPTGSSVGFSFGCSAVDRPALVVANSAAVLDQNSGTALSAGINFVAVSLDEAVGSNGILWRQNETTATGTSTYTSPSAAAASNVAKIGTLASATTQTLGTGTRLYSLMAWSRALTATELSDIYTKTRTRFGV